MGFITCVGSCAEYWSCPHLTQVLRHHEEVTVVDVSGKEVVVVKGGGKWRGRECV